MHSSTIMPVLTSLMRDTRLDRITIPTAKWKFTLIRSGRGFTIRIITKKKKDLFIFNAVRIEGATTCFVLSTFVWLDRGERLKMSGLFDFHSWFCCLRCAEPHDRIYLIPIDDDSFIMSWEKSMITSTFSALSEIGIFVACPVYYMF